MLCSAPPCLAFAEGRSSRIVLPEEGGERQGRVEACRRALRSNGSLDRRIAVAHLRAVPWSRLPLAESVLQT